MNLTQRRTAAFKSLAAEIERLTAQVAELTRERDGALAMLLGVRVLLLDAEKRIPYAENFGRVKNERDAARAALVEMLDYDFGDNPSKLSYAGLHEAIKRWRKAAGVGK